MSFLTWDEEEKEKEEEDEPGVTVGTRTDCCEVEAAAEEEDAVVDDSG